MKTISRALWLVMITLIISQQQIITNKNYIIENTEPEVIIQTERVLVEEYTIEDATKLAGILLDIDPRFIDAQWRHETSHYKSRRAIQNNNLAGMGVFNDSVEGGVYYDYQHFAYEYAKNIKNKYPQIIGCITIDEFVNGLQDGKYKWAMDPDYKTKIKSVYKKL